MCVKKTIKNTAIGIGGAIVLAVGSIVPILPPESVTPDEYVQIIEMYNIEIQKLGDVEILVEGGDTLTALNAKIREGGVDDSTEELIRKAEGAVGKMSLIDKITN